MRIVQLEQGSPAWHAWRMGGIGSSDMPVLFGVSRFKTRHQLWLEKQGLAKSDDGKNAYIKAQGHKREIELRAFASDILEEPLAVTCIEGELPWQRVSVDGITSDIETVVEAKLMKRDAFEELRDHGVIPVEYAPQLRHGIETAGASRCLFVGKNDALDDKAYAFVDLQHPALVALDTVARGNAFWKLVQDGEEPEPEGDEIVTINDPAVVNAATSYRDVLAQLKELEARRDSLRDILLHETGENRKARIGTVTVSRFFKKGNVDYKKVPQLSGVDLEPFRKKGAFQTRIDV
jgi:putative phage-type endonuclease